MDASLRADETRGMHLTVRRPRLMRSAAEVILAIIALALLLATTSAALLD